MLDMGLGKTACVLSALTPEHLPALVVAPKRVAEEVWEVERDLWRPDLSIAVARGTPSRRREALLSGSDVVVLGRDNLKDLDAVDVPFRTLVIDELSGFKNRASVRWKSARRFIVDHGVEHVWGLTGTPAPNGYLDLWGQISLLDGGERLGKNITTYRSRYFTPGRQLPSGVIIEWNLREGADARIRERMHDICLAMATDGRVELPAVSFNNVYVELPPQVRRAYRDLEANLVVDLREVFDQAHQHTATNAAVLTSRLSQITAGFLYVDDADLHGYAHTLLHSAKIDALREIMDSERVGGVLVFYRYTAERDMIMKAFPGEAHLLGEGVVRDWNAGKIPLLLAHPASAGHGLNLQYGGHTIVWTSPTWDLEHWDQANKRLARQGQKHPVVIHLILARDTVDSVICSRLEDKSDVQQDLLAFLESPV
jgi:SNF2 family DNA or RNA helicase